MKSVSKCIGCGRPRLVNELYLCKRCNRHAHDFISTEDIERYRLQHEALLEAKAKKEEKKIALKAEAELAEGEEVGEGDEAAEEGEAAEGDESEAASETSENE